MLKWFQDTFVLREFIKLTYDGSWYIATPVEACAALQEADTPKDYEIESVWMTQHQFDNLPEFNGF